MKKTISGSKVSPSPANDGGKANDNRASPLHIILQKSREHVWRKDWHQRSFWAGVSIGVLLVVACLFVGYFAAGFIKSVPYPVIRFMGNVEKQS